MNLVGQRVENRSHDANLNGRKGTVVGGDNMYTIIVKWDGIEGRHNHSPYDIVYTHTNDDQGWR
tara:strand:+ start:167 stop:358 length:192 start_codon:yes stop_codon:yes gene_type:complete